MKQIFGVHKYIIIIILFIAHFMMNVIDLFMNNNNGMPVNYFHGILLMQPTLAQTCILETKI